ncbi:MAG: asparaginase domain-containing protein [Oscillospiraceae bacterium]
MTTKVILGTRARKVRTKSYNAFSSIDYPETAILRGRQVVYYIPEQAVGAPKLLRPARPRR